MTVSIPFPLPSTGYAYNRDMRINLQAIVDKLNDFNTGDATWDNVYIGTANSDTGTIVLYNSSNANSFTIQAGATGSDLTFTLPTADGTSGDILQTNGSGTLSFTGTPTFDSQTIRDSGGITIYSGSFAVTLKQESGIGADYDWNFPRTYGNSGEILTSDGDGTFSWSSPPVVAGLQTRMAFYHDAGTAAVLEDHINYGSELYVITANHGTLGSPRTYTIPNAGANAFFIMSQGSSQDIAGSLSISSGGDLHVSEGYLRVGEFRLKGATSANNVTITSDASTAAYPLVLPAAQGSLNQVLSNDGSGNLSWDDVSSLAGGATTELDNLGTTAINADLLVDTGNTYDLGSSTKTLAEVHTKDVYFGKNGLSGTLTIYPGTADNGSISIHATDMGGSGRTLIITNAAIAATRTLTIPDPGGNASFVMTAGNQTLAGTKTFSGAITPSGGFTTSLLSDTDNTDDLGSSTVSWKDLYLDGSIKHGTNACLTMDSIGAVTKPNQPSFLATTTAHVNVTGNATAYTIAYDTEIFDQNADYNNATYTFTAPVTGRYQFSAAVGLSGLVAPTKIRYYLTTSNRTYYKITDVTPTPQHSMEISVLADMDTNDTATITIQVDGEGSDIVDVVNDARFNYFSGSLIN